MVAVPMALLQGVLAIAFLVVWADPNSQVIGLWERIVTVSQSAVASFFVITAYLSQRRAGR
jgi:hypothetical protein